MAWGMQGRAMPRGECWARARLPAEACRIQSILSWHSTQAVEGILEPGTLQPPLEHNEKPTTWAKGVDSWGKGYHVSDWGRCVE